MVRTIYFVDQLLLVENPRHLDNCILLSKISVIIFMFQNMYISEYNQFIQIVWKALVSYKIWWQGGDDSKNMVLFALKYWRNHDSWSQLVTCWIENIICFLMFYRSLFWLPWRGFQCACIKRTFNLPYFVIYFHIESGQRFCQTHQ